MRIAVMQPYIFPYIGYFQMIHAVDKFVFYDDVNYIKQGWINRNKVLVSQKEFLFTIPLKNSSSFNLINKTVINEKLYGKWKLKFLQTLNQNYKKAPYFRDVFLLVETVLSSEAANISKLAIASVIAVSNYLGLQTEFITASEAYQNKGLERQERLISICTQENAKQYINALGGKALYDKEDFLKAGIELNFIKTLPITYKQFKHDFVPWLSIIDVLMFISVDEVKELLKKYELV